MNRFVKRLGQYRDVLTKQQIKTIKGKALAGHEREAEATLQNILAKKK